MNISSIDLCGKYNPFFFESSASVYANNDFFGVFVE